MLNTVRGEPVRAAKSTGCPDAASTVAGPDDEGPMVPTDQPETPDLLSRYLQDRDAQNRARVARAWAALTAREQQLLREAAVMGYVQGARVPQDAPIPADRDLVLTVISACQSMGDLYPLTASLGAHATPRSEREELTAKVLDLHTPECHSQPCDGEVGGCTPVCSTCRENAGWPCATVQTLGRVAKCTNVLEQDDGTATPCRGYVMFPDKAVQARCTTCGAWVGAAVADYLPLPTRRT